MDKHISDIIVQACKKEGIDYKSINPNYVRFCNDAKRLGQIIFELNALTDELESIFKRHNIDNGEERLFEADIKKLHDIDHDLVKLATKIQKENEKN